MSIEPNTVKKVVLDGKTVYVKSLSVRMFRHVSGAIEAVQTSNGKLSAVNAAIDLAKSIVVGWEGFATAYSSEAFEDVLGWEQSLEILGLCLSASVLTEDERKKFG